MSPNVLEKVGHGIEVAAKDVAHVITEVVTVAEKVIKVIEDGTALTPEFKKELATLIADAKAIATAAAPAIATEGTNVVADIAALPAVINGVVKLVKDVEAFYPTLEAAFKKISADLK